MGSLNLCETIVRVSFEEDNGTAGIRRIQLDVGPVCCRMNPEDALRLHICSAAHPRYMRHPLNASGDWLESTEVGRPATLTVFADMSRRSSIQVPTFPYTPQDNIAGLPDAPQENIAGRCSFA